MTDHIVDANKKVDHILKAAKAAGWTDWQIANASPAEMDRLERFYATAFRAGMERAAEICESRANMLMLPSTSNPAVLSVAAAIRSEAGKP